jgi:xanthine dehydrogenase accessory factor
LIHLNCMKSIFENICEFLNSSRQGMLATIVWAKGSTPAPVQSKMLLDIEGNRIAGTIGGGCVEDAIMQRTAALQDKLSCVIMDFELNDDEAESGLICGGTLKVLLEPIMHSDLEIYTLVSERYGTGLDSIVFAEIHSDGKISHSIFNERGTLLLGNPAHHSVIPSTIYEKYEPIFKNIDGTNYLVEPIEGKTPLYIFGGGHVGKAIAKLSSIAGFNVTIVDDRIEFAHPDMQPDANETICISFRNLSGHIKISKSAFAVIVTRGHHYDELVLEQVLQSEAKYIGMIGSKTKVMVTFQQLVEKGVRKEEFERIFAPIGLDIGSVSVEEIAISVVAEMIKIKRKGLRASSLEHKKLA